MLEDPETICSQDEKDDQLISNLLDSSGKLGDDQLDLINRSLDIGEKADDAVDYENISLSSFDDEECEIDTSRSKGTTAAPFASDGVIPLSDAKSTKSERAKVNIDDVDDDGLGDLFDDQTSHDDRPFAHDSPKPVTDDVLYPFKSSVKQEITAESSDIELVNTDILPENSTSPKSTTQFRSIDFSGSQNGVLSVFDDADDAETREQLELFRQAREEREERLRRAAAISDRGLNVENLPPPPQCGRDLFESIWPDFDPNEVPYFAKLFSQKRASYTGKQPPKALKPIYPTKVSLEVAPDTQRLFFLPGPAKESKQERLEHARRNGLVLLLEENSSSESDSDFENDCIDWDEDVGGLNIRELATFFEDWEPLDSDNLYDIKADDDAGNVKTDAQNATNSRTSDTHMLPCAKKRRLNSVENQSFIPTLFDTKYDFTEPEVLTVRLAQRVIIDTNDSQLLLDPRKSNSVGNVSRADNSLALRPANMSKKEWIINRFNVSNDAAYDLLKENRSHKVRSNLGNLTVEHSLPAVKLQYPFYKVKLTPREARTLHRPMMKFQPNAFVHFSPLRTIKRKNLKNKTAVEKFCKAKDLNVGDNSTLVLLEYSEEYPTLMSNFGMASRLINYYRKQDANDTNRPKLDIGETIVLLTEDKSPFSLFGNVEAGSQVPTLQNAMFRAPVFRHSAQSTDFLISRSTTGLHGSEWYIRPVENVFLVGQEFPCVEVPGTHSRKVTEAAKRRLRMISYRIYNKYARSGGRDKHCQPLTNEIIKKHLPGTDISQNRGKMREFMQYDKETCTWIPKRGETPPDTESLRGWIKPEDVCLLDSMQVGHRQLLDAGYNQDDAGEDEKDDSIEQKLAPWNTTKNFLNACQGKAMLELHGDGDPSGRGEGFSFVKTSMKGGFKTVGESIEDRLDARRIKDNGGHSYNVAKQQKAYEDAIKRIWDAQMKSLQSTVGHDDAFDPDVDGFEGCEMEQTVRQTPNENDRSPSRRDDESLSQFSRMSGVGQRGKTLKITRTFINRYGNEEVETEIIDNVRVIKEYLKRRKQEDLNSLSLNDLKPTGDPEIDAHQQKRLLEELARLERNKERRHVREMAKGLPKGEGIQGSPLSGTGKPFGTQRKCANCGQIGHIKTNKKLCPMLNGSRKVDETVNSSTIVQVSPSVTSPIAPI